ncbi:MAG: hypothetical protein COS84_04335 [Armatimonadetes bacterium CG07_land_8_20_14_0_80_40_9]|nr:MAG: hypothetical protein COS84_04335 [Armatimonadetes bacterium CG07_land_8_20_14_0_80_40_9]
MNNLILVKKRWQKSNLPPVFYHTTFIESAPLILKEQKVVANKGKSICKEKNGMVSLSDRISKGNIEFFGNVVFEFYAISIYMKNKLIVPRNYGSSSDISKYEEKPLFENEWVIPKGLKFDSADINEVLLITSRHLKESAFKNVVRVLKNKSIEHIFLSERTLPDNNVTDMTSYILRMRSWKKFNKVAKYV